MGHVVANPLQSESPRAWDDLIDSVGPASLLVLIEMRMSNALKRHMTAEDIWQEALLHAWRDKDQFEWRGLRSFRSWLLTIIDHRIHEAVKRESAAKRGGGVAPVSAGEGSASTDSRSGVNSFPAGSTTPSRVAVHRERASAIRSALESLPADVREIVRLRLLEQRSLEEVATQLDSTVPTIRYRFARGLELYRERLRAYFSTHSQPAAGDPAISSAVPAPESSPE